MKRSKTTSAGGWTRTAYPISLGVIVAEGNADDERGGDDRVSVYTTDDTGQVWRTFVERNPDGEPIVTSERVSGAPVVR